MTRDKAALLFEEHWPAVVGFLSALLPLSENIFGIFLSHSGDRLVEKFIDICAIGIGFWATAATILLALETRETVRSLRDLGYYEKIVDYFFSSIIGLSLLLFCSLVFLVAEPPTAPVAVRLYAMMWFMVVTYTSAAIWRAFRILAKLLKSR